MKFPTVTQGLSISGKKNKRGVTLCARHGSSFYWSHRAGPAWVGLLRALPLNMENPHVCFCDHISNKGYHSASIHMFERRQLLLIKLETALDYCGCPAPPPPRAPPEPNTRPDGSLALPGGSTACYGSVCGQESGEEFPATLAGVGVGLPNSGSASCQILPAGQELHPARGVWPFSLRSADSSLLSSVPRPTSYTM